MFVATVGAGSFAKSAQRLALTRSAIGKAIARLEARLGAPLFRRTTRSLTLTPDGQLYYERCVRALEELRQGEAMLASGRLEVSGKLKVAMPVLFGSHCVAPILLELAHDNPGLHLDLRFSDSMVDLVADGYDLAVRIGVPGDQPGLMTKRVAGLMKTVCAAPSYVSLRGEPSAVVDLADHEVLILRLHDRPYFWDLHDAYGPIPDLPLAGRLQFDNHTSMVDAALRGMGIAQLPEWLVRPHVEAGRLLPLLESFSAPPTDTYVVWPAVQFEPLRLRAAIDALAAKLVSRI
ncbi:LysR family transcriptional regulator [Rhizorhabdus argentea]|uniref:LysR family transcriptional regulator n=1 Tax=Rhizorhabdus argentea TaxID=1387174 RepID=UPI0030EF9650